MAIWSSSPLPHLLLGLLSLLLLHSTTSTSGTRLGTTFNILLKPPPSSPLPLFKEAPAFRNADTCGSSQETNNIIHITMTLDTNYIRGTMAAVLSILQHSTCPENMSFHFLSSKYLPEIISSIKSTFPYLTFRIYRFDSNRVRGKISKSIRQALDQPLNYARIYLADIIPLFVDRVIYLDSDIIVADDIRKLWDVEMDGKIVAAPEYCQANFTQYFNDDFWSDSEMVVKAGFEKRSSTPCYFNTGVMVMDLNGWRKGKYTERVEEWMAVQKKEKRIYQLGSLPPFLLVLAGNIKGVDHRWNQHGLGGDNFEGKCRSLHPGPISLLHWSGKGKPWLRLDSRKPCPVDHLWAPYDLYRSSRIQLEE